MAIFIEEMRDCKDCAYGRRCNHICSCINKAYTNNPKQTSPFTCEIEMLMINIADNIAETLYAEKNPVFIQKFYNMYYSNIEKIINKKRSRIKSAPLIISYYRFELF